MKKSVLLSDLKEHHTQVLYEKIIEDLLAMPDTEVTEKSIGVSAWEYLCIKAQTENLNLNQNDPRSLALWIQDRIYTEIRKQCLAVQDVLNYTRTRVTTADGLELKPHYHIKPDHALTTLTKDVLAVIKVYTNDTVEKYIYSLNNMDEDDECEDEEENEDDEPTVYNMAESYLVESICQLLDDLIPYFEAKDEASENEDGSDVEKLQKLQTLIRHGKDYDTDGYIILTIKDKGEYESFVSYRFWEIEYGIDGFEVKDGGYDKNELGGDAYSSSIYPFGDEYEAMDVVTISNHYTSGVRDALEGDFTLEIVDCMDKMEFKRKL